MAKLKVRKKKFNPNRISPAATRQCQHDASLRRDMAQKFPMEMEYVGHHVHEYIERKKLDEKELFDLFSDSKTLPFHIALGAYDWQNMGIVLVLDHIKPCEWFIHTNIHLMNIHEEETNMVTVSGVRFNDNLTRFVAVLAVLQEVVREYGATCLCLVHVPVVRPGDVLRQAADVVSRVAHEHLRPEERIAPSKQFLA